VYHHEQKPFQRILDFHLFLSWYIQWHKLSLTRCSWHCSAKDNLGPYRQGQMCFHIAKSFGFGGGSNKEFTIKIGFLGLHLFQMPKTKLHVVEIFIHI
jgi:hypothetical protein